jgi:hypothetical protein
MPTPDAVDYEYRRPLDTAQAVLDDLWGQWNDLSGAAQMDLTAILASFRARLFRAEGDTARGTAVPSLLYALEDAPLLPAGTRTLLEDAHQARRRAFFMLSSDQAREIKDAIDRLIGPDNDLAPATAPATGDEAFPEAPNIAERVISRLNSRWAELSLLGQDQVFLWLRSYDDALAGASNDYERLLATHDFLNQIKGSPSAYALTEDAFTVRSAGIPSFGAGAQAMTQKDAGRVRDLIDRNPLMAVPKTPWGPNIHFSMAESAPPPPPLALAALVEPTVVDYHTDVRFPGRQVSTFDQDIPLRVRLALEKSESSVADGTVAIEFVTPDPQQVLVVCNAEGFIVDTKETTDTTRTILVYPGQDSQWAVFLLTPDPEAGPGMRHIGLDFYHRGRLAGTARFEVEVRDRPPIEKSEIKPEPMIVDRAEDGSVVEQVAGGFVFSSEDALKPNFELRITLSADRRQLSYTLNSPDGKLGLVHRRMGSVTLEADPRTFLENTLLQLSQMARASRKKLSDAQIVANQEKLREIGWDLYEQLFTDKLKQAYRDLYQLRQTEQDLSLLIISDEPWIPWEMVLPHEGLPDEDFLCAQFRLTRWLEGRGLPQDFSLHQAQVVTPKSNLASVKVEQDYFTFELPKLRPEITLGPSWLDTAMQVKLALRQGDSQWFHFACHGDFDATRPDESALMLQGDAFTPSQIVGPMRRGVAASRPLVFLNACHTAEAGFSLTRMGGWAERFVRAGASAFVGSLWEVNDELAAQFAIKFYNELLAGQTLGEAFHTARSHIRGLDDANPTWLAYTLYADPNGRVKEPVIG